MRAGSRDRGAGLEAGGSKGGDESDAKRSDEELPPPGLHSPLLAAESSNHAADPRTPELVGPSDLLGSRAVESSGRAAVEIGVPCLHLPRKIVDARRPAQRPGEIEFLLAASSAGRGVHEGRVDRSKPARAVLRAALGDKRRGGRGTYSGRIDEVA